MLLMSVLLCPMLCLLLGTAPRQISAYNMIGRSTSTSIRRFTGTYNRLSIIRSSGSFQEEFDPYRASFPDLNVTQLDQLAQLRQLLIDWNSKVNLVSRKGIDFLVPNHIVPSLAVSRVVCFAPGARIVDVGSGGGFPGLPMAIACPAAHFTLLDSSGKKMKIVSEMASALGLQNVRTVTSRAEQFNDAKFDFMLGRSVSVVPNFLSFSCHLLEDTSSESGSGRRVSTVRSSDPISTTATATGNGTEVTAAASTIRDGLLYIKGGDFTDELTEAGIRKYALHPINQLVPALEESDKSVLHISSAEVRKFHERQLKTAAAADALRKSNKILRKFGSNGYSGNSNSNSSSRGISRGSSGSSGGRSYSRRSDSADGSPRRSWP